LHSLFTFFSQYARHTTLLHSFPTRRSSDLSPPPPRWMTFAGSRRIGTARSSFRGYATADSRSRWKVTGPRGWRSRWTRRWRRPRSEEHTSELQSRFDLVCRLLLEKKKNKKD